MKNNAGYPLTRQENGKKAVRGLLVLALLLVSIVTMVSIIPTFTAGLDPHVISGTVYEENGTVVPNGTVVTITNVRTGESSNTTTNATGGYGFNLLNLPSGYLVGDRIQCNATNGTGSAGRNSTTILTGTAYTIIDIWIGTVTSTTGTNFYIIDKNGYPVESCYINIKDSSGDIVTTLLTDSDGKASADLSDGIYTITLTKSGFDDRVYVIRVHGCDYALSLLGVEVVGVTLSGMWFWLLLIFAIIGLVVILGYFLKKV